MDLSSSVELQNDTLETVLWLRSHDNISGDTFYHQVTLSVVSQGAYAHGTMPCVRANIKTFRTRHEDQARSVLSRHGFTRDVGQRPQCDYEISYPYIDHTLILKHIEYMV